MSECERPYDRYRRNRKHDLRSVLLTNLEIRAAREALGEAVRRLPNPPTNMKQTAAYSAMEELAKPAPRAAERERALVGALRRANDRGYFDIHPDDSEEEQDEKENTHSILAKMTNGTRSRVMSERPKWLEIETAPRDGRPIEVAWYVSGVREEGPVITRWKGNQWEGGYTPTHWLCRPGFDSDVPDTLARARIAEQNYIDIVQKHDKEKADLVGALKEAIELFEDVAGECYQTLYLRTILAKHEHNEGES